MSSSSASSRVSIVPSQHSSTVAITGKFLKIAIMGGPPDDSLNPSLPSPSSSSKFPSMSGDVVSGTCLKLRRGTLTEIGISALSSSSISLPASSSLSEISTLVLFLSVTPSIPESKSSHDATSSKLTDVSLAIDFLGLAE